MMPVSGCDKVWSQEICSDIDSAVMTVMGQIQRARYVLHPTILASGQTSVPADILAAPRDGPLRIEEGQTKPLVELSFEFSLTQSQVDSEASLHSGKTLALFAANKVAQAEDKILFEGKDAQLPSGVKSFNKDSAAGGLLGAAGETIEVPQAPDTGYPESIFTAVVDGISKLVSKGQGGPYALFLDSSVFAAAYAPLPQTLVTTADRIIPLVPGGFSSVPTLTEPHKGDRQAVPIGLLVSLGGELTSIYVGTDTTTAYTQQDQEGRSCFRVFERIQFVARDAGALVKFRFVHEGSRERARREE